MTELKKPILLVSGTRTIDDPLYVKNCLDEIRKTFKFNSIIHGDADGVDHAAEFYAIYNNIICKSYPAKWNVYGKAAGLIRNNLMIKLCNKGVVIWDGKSPGSKHAKTELQRQHKLLKVFYYNGDQSLCQDCGSKIVFMKELNTAKHHYTCSCCLKIYD